MGLMTPTVRWDLILRQAWMVSPVTERVGVVSFCVRKLTRRTGSTHSMNEISSG